MAFALHRVVRAWWFLALLVAIPYLFALVAGQPDPATTGFGAWHSAATSVYCARGWTPVTALLLVEFGLFLLWVLAAQWLAGRHTADALAAVHHGWPLLVLFGLIALPFFIGWQTDSSVCVRGRAFFWESILIDTFIMALLAISYNLLFGFTGIVSFGHAAFFGMGAYTVGLLLKFLTAPWWLAILGALVVGVVIALIKGLIGLRIKGLYFALFTLAFAQVFYLLAGNRLLVTWTGAEDGFTFTVPDWLNLVQNRLGFYYLTLAVLAWAYWLVQRVLNSPTGRVLRALHDNEERAQMIGYNTFHFKLIAIVLAGVLAALAGVLRGLALKGANPGLLGLDFTMTPLLMTIVGGSGTLAGPVIGAFLLHLTEEALRNTVITLGGVAINIGERWALLLGMIFIVIVLIFPHGIVGTLQRWWLRLTKRS
ncbi:MAG: branched-chain amino acid ABC transporter permease [Caldilineaceae bacterium]